MKLLMKLQQKIPLGKGAIGAAFLISFVPAGIAFNYLPTWAPGEHTAKYLFAVLIFMVAYIVLLIVSILALGERNTSNSVDRLGYRAFALAQLAGEGIASHLVFQSNGKAAIGHYIDSKGDPSPLSSAYAIRAILACPLVVTCASLRPLVQYVIDCRHDSGWKAASQSQPRPEVTADVIRAIRAIDGDSDTYKSGVEGLRVQSDADPASLEVTYVAATVLISLPLFSSVAPLRTKIGNAIVSGFIATDQQTGYWCGSLGPGRTTATPSAAATARCMLALKAQSEFGDRQSTQAICQKAMRWLASLDHYPNETEQVVRSLSAGKTEVLVPRHFSSALVALAASAWSDLECARVVADRSMKEVVNLHVDGYWRWDDGKSAVWMNTQGIEAANAYIGALAHWVSKP